VNFLACVSPREYLSSMTEREFLRLLRFYLACIEAEDQLALTKGLSTHHRSLLSPWDREELLFHLDAPEIALEVNLGSDRKLLLEGAALVNGAERFFYGYPVFLDKNGFLSPLFFTHVEVAHADDRRFVIRPAGALQLNHHVFNRHQTQPEELRAMRSELEGQFGSFAMRLHATFEVLESPMPPFLPDQLERFPKADSPWNRWVNRPILFKSERKAHTHLLRGELEALAENPRLSGALGTTAAGVLAGIRARAWKRATTRTADTPQLLQVLPLNRGQENAARAGLCNPLAVVTGPPGTGKSQVVVNLLASCALARCSVLFSSRNNKAVDVVRDRLRATLGQDRDWTLRFGTRQTMAESRQEMSARLGALRPEAAPPLPLLTRIRPAGFWLKVGHVLDSSGMRRLCLWASKALGVEESADILVERLDTLRRRRAELAAKELGAVWTHRVAQRALSIRHCLGRYFDLSSRVGQHSGSAFLRVRDQFKSTVRALSMDLPVWIVTNLSVRNAVPLEPALFELLILDEASQCDIPSALPLLFRARRVIVIGDPRQLRHISTLSASKEESLAREHNVAHLLPEWSYNECSLFALAESKVIEQNADPVFLAEHYRSHPEIIEFSNHAFYHRRLIVRTALDRLRDRLEDEPLGLYWHDVRGSVSRSACSAVNELEVRAVLDLLDEWSNSGFLLRDRVDFGIVTPFRLQMERLDEAIRTRPWWDQVKGRLTVGTAHRFQGDERDVMIFSPVVAEGMVPRLVRWVADADQLLNVALTRARAALHVVGDHSACLASGGFLGNFAAAATSRCSTRTTRAPSASDAAPPAAGRDDA
jgi:hypothetical protein